MVKTWVDQFIGWVLSYYQSVSYSWAKGKGNNMGFGRKEKVFQRKNGKVLHEFLCSNCSGYVTVKLDEDMNGAHCVICPGCDHKHYRIIKDGVITEDRAPKLAG